MAPCFFAADVFLIPIHRAFFESPAALLSFLYRSFLHLSPFRSPSFSIIFLSCLALQPTFNPTPTHHCFTRLVCPSPADSEMCSFSSPVFLDFSDFAVCPGEARTKIRAEPSSNGCASFLRTKKKSELSVHQMSVRTTFG